MPPFIVAPCSIEDGPALGHNNISAFWTDSTWVLIWPGKTMEYVAEQAARRMAKNLLSDPERRRHQMAVDSKSGTIVGYARWILPQDGTANMPAKDLWLEARVPSVSEEQEREAESAYAAADWNFDHSLDDIDEPMLEIKDRLMKQKKYLLLDYLAVAPENRGQGIATMLVESGVKEAEKMGLDVFVLGMKAGLGVYKRVGFKLLDQVIMDDSKYGGKGEYGAYFLEKRSCKKVSYKLVWRNTNY